MNKKKYYITTAIAYTSGKPHIGNTYEAVLADSIARYKRMAGYDVFFQTGTDEHGQKIQDKAKEANITPKEFVDNVAGVIKDTWDQMGTSYDNFVRTTDEYHEEQVQKIFKKLYDKGDIYLSEYEGLYCTPCESFWTESQLVDGLCPDCQREVVKAKEEAYFFKLSKYEEALVKHIEENPMFIQPVSRKNEMVNNFLKPGLQDLCVSRTTFDWGVKVPFDKKHVVYVWIDALSNYITGLGYDVDGNHQENFNKYWPCDVHLIGKDILRFHTLYWPIMLMALDIELPKQVFGHPWLNMSDGKMSKSKGNVLYADDLVKYFGVDAVRYYVLHETPFAQDGIINHELIMERINSDLANILGNLVNRTISMTKKYFNGIVLKPGEIEDIDKELIDLALSIPKKQEKLMDELKVADAISEVFVLLRRSNKYIDETMPWILGKDESQKDRLARVLYNFLESIRFSAVMLSPFMPETSKRIFEQLNVSDTTFDSLKEFGAIKVGHSLNEAEILFSRIDIKEKLEEINGKTKKIEEKKEDLITIDDFSKIELKVGKIISVKKHEKADKLLVLKIDMGKRERQVVSGIADFYSIDNLVGKNVVVVTNLKPVKLRGVLSEGMILAAKSKKDLKIVVTEGDIKAGSSVK